MQAICDRFGSEVALVMVNDDIAYNSGLLIRPRMFLEIFPERMKRLIAPAKACGKLVLMHTDGKMEKIKEIGGKFTYAANDEVENYLSLKKNRNRR